MCTAINEAMQHKREQDKDFLTRRKFANKVKFGLAVALAVPATGNKTRKC